MKTTRRNFFKISGILAGLAVLNPVKLCKAVGKSNIEGPEAIPWMPNNPDFVDWKSGTSMCPEEWRIRINSNGIDIYDNGRL